MDLSALISGIKLGDRLALAKAITLIESSKQKDRMAAMQLITELYDHRKNAIRLGITGIPGVGKSTFIEKLGKHITSLGLRVAVLAVDPSSSRSSGSILGDKTRMEELSRDPHAFIRPSPSGGTLGGIAARTRETMLLCEAAGFDVIIIETVGVGQSETEIINITDCFLMLAMPGTGDELQGIKRGIMESADVIVINKADGDLLDQARKAKKQIEMALHLFPSAESGWQPKVLLASALHNEGISECWKAVNARQKTIEESGWLQSLRKQQQERAFQKMAERSIYEYVFRNLNSQNVVDKLEEGLKQGWLNEFEATLQLLREIN
ncbi:MAG: methylmalonyl Co-A mutase-associated GTPase MeaB [Flavobacteriales bacterium]